MTNKGERIENKVAHGFNRGERNFKIFINRFNGLLEISNDNEIKKILYGKHL